MIGVIGGMGPLATVDFMQKVIEACGAADDADQVPMIVSCDPRIAGRPAAILHGGVSPLPALRAIRDRLVDAGATALVMPCNTAHHWHAELAADCALPFPSIVEAGCDATAAGAAPGTRIGVLATRATLQARLYDAGLAARGLVGVAPNDDELERWLVPCIAHVKAGRIAPAAALLAQVLRALAQRGAERMLLACTELPIALAASGPPPGLICIDTNLALARVTVALWQRQAGDRATG